MDWRWTVLCRFLIGSPKLVLMIIHRCCKFQLHTPYYFTNTFTTLLSLERSYAIVIAAAMTSGAVEKVVLNVQPVMILFRGGYSLFKLILIISSDICSRDHILVRLEYSEMLYVLN